MKFELFESLGGPTLYLNDDNGWEIQRLKLPKELLPRIAESCIREVMNNGTTEDKMWLLAKMDDYSKAFAQTYDRKNFPKSD